ncbi:tol-pal system protein YbgF [Jannaschia faecimaris]|uniref:Cell division coordinator CpoB n=1 Tax=Jannaschia faecimaris TaxID=1244108 RepID=A0A1H3L942_9RHOB|nr:tol-pal system protein YbgF [Jannaschia faecimaris]SDY60454.1 tol-pal system protein YbgF [Jannaschia faecimaris]
MLRAATLALALAVTPVAALAQQDQTLADIRQQLSVLRVEMQKLTGELNTTGAPGVSVGGSTVPDRVNAIESELQRLTQQTERLSFRVESVARDGSARIEDLRFQLCELTSDCDLAALPSPTPLGGAETGAEPAASGGTAPTGDASGGAQLAVGEQADFDRARAALDAGNNAEAAQLFEQFVTAYPTGPLSTDAHFFRGQALARDSQHAAAARAYLEAFSGTPEGPRAAESLVGLGTALGSLGQTDEACLTLSEVAIRFPQSPAVAQANSARAGLGCTG